MRNLITFVAMVATVYVMCCTAVYFGARPFGCTDIGVDGIPYRLSWTYQPRCR